LGTVVRGKVGGLGFVLMRNFKRRHRAGGFTLLEASFTIMIVGTGVLATVAAQQAFHRQNDWAQRSGTAMLLANELRELTLTLPLSDPITGTATVGPEIDESGVADFDDVDDFAGALVDGVRAGMLIDPPINALRQTINDLPGWSQLITVVSVDPNNISASTPQTLGSTDMLRVTVSVMYESPQDTSARAVSQLTWVVGQ
jgi:hypothetical protein